MFCFWHVPVKQQEVVFKVNQSLHQYLVILKIDVWTKTIEWPYEQIDTELLLNVLNISNKPIS